jgi:hypothetical protein
VGIEPISERPVGRAPKELEFVVGLCRNNKAAPRDLVEQIVRLAESEQRKRGCREVQRRLLTQGRTNLVDHAIVATVLDQPHTATPFVIRPVSSITRLRDY